MNGLENGKAGGTWPAGLSLGGRMLGHLIFLVLIVVVVTVKVKIIIKKR
ncbi:MAG: hypothetical protein U1E70_17455 [Acetobacteraceae bacterium]|nr:hypothetical protein [Pseudomonadota bacterium]